MKEADFKSASHSPTDEIKAERKQKVIMSSSGNSSNDVPPFPNRRLFGER